MNDLNKNSESFFNVDWDAEFSEEISDHERDIIKRVGERIAQTGMIVPAIMFLETMKPFNWMGSQLMLFLEPFTAYVLGFQEIVDLRRALSKRECMELLIVAIEEGDIKEKEKKPNGVLRQWVRDIFKKKEKKKIKN